MRNRYAGKQDEITDLRGLVYGRVSTEEQDANTSLETQVRESQRYANEHGIQVVGTYTEDFTGKTLNRPELRNVLNRLQNGDANALIVYVDDRLSRNYVDFLVLRDNFEQAGIQLHFVNRGQSLSGFNGLLLDGINALLAHGERENIARRFRDGKYDSIEHRNRPEAVMSLPPYGYDSQGKGKERVFIINEYESEVIRRIFYWYVVEGIPILAIAKRLMGERIPPYNKRKFKRRPPKHPRNEGWSTSTVRKILKNEMVAGFFTWPKRQFTPDGKFIDVPMEYRVRSDIARLQIVETSLYEAAQKRMEYNIKTASRNKKRFYLCSGHMRCGSCGTAMVGHSGHYRCARGIANKQGLYSPCPAGKNTIDSEVVDYIVWNYLVWFVEDDQNIINSFKQIEEHAKEIIDPLRARAETVKRLIEDDTNRISELMSSFGGNKNKTIQATLSQQVNESAARTELLQKELDEINLKLAQTEVQPGTVDRILKFAQTIRGRMEEITGDDMRFFMQALKVSITFDISNPGTDFRFKDAPGERSLNISLAFSEVGERIVIENRFNKAAQEEADADIAVTPYSGYDRNVNPYHFLNGTTKVADGLVYVHTRIIIPPKSFPRDQIRRLFERPYETIKAIEAPPVFWNKMSVSTAWV